MGKRVTFLYRKEKLKMSKKIFIINGPNLNLLGTREPEIYGSETLKDIEKSISDSFKGTEFSFFQSNKEGELIEFLHQAKSNNADGIIINAGGYTHTSVAIRDAISAVSIPTIEVHLSNVFAREDFRHHSYISAVCKGIISGFGSKSYHLAVQSLLY
jgi:3-dehydroquinate dehydratase II